MTLPKKYYNLEVKCKAINELADIFNVPMPQKSKQQGSNPLENALVASITTSVKYCFGNSVSEQPVMV